MTKTTKKLLVLLFAAANIAIELYFAHLVDINMLSAATANLINRLHILLALPLCIFLWQWWADDKPINKSLRTGIYSFAAMGVGVLVLAIL